MTNDKLSITNTQKILNCFFICYVFLCNSILNVSSKV